MNCRERPSQEIERVDWKQSDAAIVPTDNLSIQRITLLRNFAFAVRTVLVNYRELVSQLFFFRSHGSVPAKR